MGQGALCPLHHCAVPQGCLERSRARTGCGHPSCVLLELSQPPAPTGWSRLCVSHTVSPPCPPKGLGQHLLEQGPAMITEAAHISKKKHQPFLSLQEPILVLPPWRHTEFLRFTSPSMLSCPIATDTDTFLKLYKRDYWCTPKSSLLNASPAGIKEKKIPGGLHGQRCRGWRDIAQWVPNAQITHGKSAFFPSPPPAPHNSCCA